MLWLSLVGWLVIWLVGHMGDLLPNGERYGVGLGLNRGHIGKCFQFVPSNLTLDDPEGP